MSIRVVLRTTQQLSYAGEARWMSLNEEDGVAIQPSERSGIFLWCPLEEIDCLIVQKNIIKDKEGIKDVLQS